MREPAITQEQLQTLNAIRAKVAPIARDFDAPPVHWISGADEGFDYCFECAEIEVEKLKAKDDTGEYCIDGGWDGCREADGSTTCNRCHRILGYSLTRYGLLAEVGHFIETIIECPLQPCSAYEIDAILDAAEYCDDPEVIEDALKIGSEALHSIDQSEQFERLALDRWADDGGPVYHHAR